MSTANLTAKHLTARAYAEAGIKVFPCSVNGKKPACANGFHDATTDLKLIDYWWTCADYNIGMVPEDAGRAVVDLDINPEKGKDGEPAWAELQTTNGQAPETFEVRTPGGGRHLHFSGSIPQTASKLGKDIDTRGRLSYVLVPPSEIDGKFYEVIHDRDIAPLPHWIADAVERTHQSMPAAISDLDTDASLARARALLTDYVGRGDVAIAGRGGDLRTFQLSCELLNLGVSQEVSLTLLEEIWNPHCVPPWSREELGVKIENASNYAQNEPGAWAVPPAAEVFGATLDALPSTQPEGRSRFYFENVKEQEEGKDQKWLFKNLIPDAATVMIVGPKGNFKSFIAHDLLLGAAANMPSFGIWPERSGPTFYGAHEGRFEMRRPRRQAWEIVHDLRGADYPFFIAPAPRIARVEECDAFREQIRVQLRKANKHVAGIVLDTVAKCMAGMDENSAMDAGQFVEFCDSLLYEFECPVIALHHTKKDGSRGGRGSGALEAGFSTVIDVERTGKLVSVRVRHHRDAEEPAEAWTLQARPFGPSLVFFPITAAEKTALAREQDHFDPRKVGAVLQTFNAYGWDQGVTTITLATDLAPLQENDTEETHESTIAKTTRLLSLMSKRKLEAYCERRGRDLRWFLPAPAAGEFTGS